jgi:glycine hydroxymethyltransferase
MSDSAPTASVDDRPWLPEAARRFIAAEEARLSALDIDGLDLALHAAVAAQEAHLDRECINLYAGTNAPNPRVSRLLSSTIGSRPNLGYPGDKYNTGMHHADEVEVLLAHALRRLFGCRFVETRVASGSLANLYVYMATCRPGDTVLSFSDAAAGHPTHRREGAAGLYGLNILDMPFDVERMDVDIDALRKLAPRVKPKLMIVAGSMCLFPYSVRQVREIADGVGATVMYDAAHMGGMIAGGRFQQPLAEGAHVMTGSTYKSFGGPPAGMILTDSPELAQRIEAVAYPGLSANFDLAKTAALALAVLDLLEHGSAYAARCLDNAAALAEALAERQVSVFGVSGKGYTASHHVALKAAAYGGGNKVSRRMAETNVLFTSIGLPVPEVKGEANGIRIGTQEISRWGFAPNDMADIAELIARVLVRGEAPERVKADAIALRRRFQSLHFVRA